MVVRARSIVVGVWVGLGLGACFTAELDPEAGGAFACDDDGDCPEDMGCIEFTCQPWELVPVVEITSPTQGFEFDPAVRQISLMLEGDLDIVPPGGAHVFGEGHVEVTLDGAPVRTLETGELSGRGFDLELPAGAPGGAKRIAIRLLRNDREPYTHEGAKATRLVWLQDGLPHVAIARPWPGDVIASDADSIDIEISTLNFTISDINVDAGGDGHVHVFSDEQLPECARDNGCTMNPNVYTALVGPTGSLTLPPEGEVLTIGAMLVTPAHCPFGGDTEDGSCVGTETPVFDTLTVSRTGPPEDD